MSLAERKLLDLADSISRGEPVDWKKETEDAPGVEDRSLLEALELLAGIAGFHAREAANERGASQPAFAPGERWGPLEIVRALRTGSFGEVYLARDLRLDREVALKILSEPSAGELRGAEVESAIDEARRLARVRHPNVAVVYGAERLDGRTGIWMEFIRGTTIEERLADAGPLAPEEAAVMGAQLCRALAAIHAEGLLHRDVKLGNVMREEGGRFVLLDFGLARERPASDLSDPTAPAPLSGTPLYLAPEVLAGESASPRSDLYSLGVALFRAVSGRYPVTADTLEELRAAHRRGAMLRPRDARPELGERFVQLLEHALARDPSARFQSAGEMERALLETLALEAALPRRTVKPARLRTGIAVALLAALAVFVASRVTNSSYRVEAVFQREEIAGLEPLLPGARVAPGDALALAFEASRPLFVYVLNEDDRGQAFLLFPLPGYELTNPVPGGAHRLPGMRAGRDARWQVTSAGGREHFLIVASPKPVPALEEAIQSLAPAEAGRPIAAAPLGGPAVERLRGTGGIVDAGSRTPGMRPPGAPSGGGRLAALARSLGSGTEEAHGVWVRAVEFENP